MRYLRPVRAALAATTAVLLFGCTAADAGDGPTDGGEGATAGSSPAAEASGEPSPRVAEPPADPAAALALARAVAATPTDLGDGFVPQDPYESDPATWAVLDEGCVWRRAALPEEVLASLSRYSEHPAPGGEGEPLRVMSSVTVHRSTTVADERMAATLEEGMRCPEQTLRPGESVTGLRSEGAPYGVRGQLAADDMIHEGGQYHGPGPGGPHPYLWGVARLGPVTVALAVKGTVGYDEEDVGTLLNDAIELMLSRAESELR
ncbi:hypothetical protein [Streptomyces millisiae]|uniref:PknH-like extracellular domain-containing protein n=1 Tax=Streptomyces millisiae TaxID=3075542 RepID=A0ABU2LIL4_9ACTN|nr:hypothetical protein [Streptomyces sp. DSM 44918]MDT0317429.1 hypothetical protein [Streptomyces sp. DSM 44918]